MTQKKKAFEDAAKDIDAGLAGLFGALNDAIGDVMARLDDGTSGTVEHDHTFETPKGPVRAQAGIRLRMGGMEVNTAGAEPKPVNPKRPRAAPAPASSPRGLSYEIIADEDVWVLTADVPGVSRKDVQLSQDRTVLKISTTGQRRYATDADLEGEFAVEEVQTSLRNGILTLRIPRGAAA